MNKLQIETSTILLQKKELRKKAKELLKKNMKKHI